MLFHAQHCLGDNRGTSCVHPVTGFLDFSEKHQVNQGLEFARLLLGPLPCAAVPC